MIISFSSQSSRESYYNYSYFTDEITQGQLAQGPIVINWKIQDRSIDRLTLKPHPLISSLDCLPSHNNAKRGGRWAYKHQKTVCFFLIYFCRQVTEDNLAGHVFYKILHQGKMLITLELFIKRTKRQHGKHPSAYRWSWVEHWLHSSLSYLTSLNFNFIHP